MKLVFSLKKRFWSLLPFFPEIEASSLSFHANTERREINEQSSQNEKYFKIDCEFILDFDIFSCLH